MFCEVYFLWCQFGLDLKRCFLAHIFVKVGQVALFLVETGLVSVPSCLEYFLHSLHIVKSSMRAASELSHFFHSHVIFQHRGDLDLRCTGHFNKFPSQNSIHPIDPFHLKLLRAEIQGQRRLLYWSQAIDRLINRRGVERESCARGTRRNRHLVIVG